MQVFPETPQIGTEYAYNQGEFIDIAHPSGRSDGLVKVTVVDPNKLTGDKYSVFFTLIDSLAWNLVNETKADTIIKNSFSFAPLEGGVDSSKNTYVIDGFVIAVSNPGVSAPTVREISLTKENGTDVEPVGNIRPYVPRLGANCFGVGTTNSDRKWWLASVSSAGASSIQNLAGGSIGKDDYEIRFNGTNNEYYTFSPGLANPRTKSNPVAKDNVPLEFWNIGDPNDPNDDKRLYVKVYDFATANKSSVGNKDSLWTSTALDFSRLDRDSIAYEDLYFMNPLGGSTYTEPIPNPSGISNGNNDYPIINLTFMSKTFDRNDLPGAGTVIRIATWKPITIDDKYEFVATAPKINDLNVAKNRLNEISVFPNPYFGAHSIEPNKYSRFVRFTNLPNQATIRIFNLAGVFIARIDKDDLSQFVDWNLLNRDLVPVASGIYIAYIEIEGVGSTILKIAIIQETQYIDRL